MKILILTSSTKSIKPTIQFIFCFLSVIRSLTVFAAEPDLPQVPPNKQNADQQSSPEFKTYMTKLQQQIVHVWFPAMSHEHDRVVTTITIGESGNLLKAKVIKSSGFKLSDNAALKAIENAAPFPHLPKNAGHKAEIRFTFDYSVLRSEASKKHSTKD